MSSNFINALNHMIHPTALNSPNIHPTELTTEVRRHVIFNIFCCIIPGEMVRHVTFVGQVIQLATNIEVYAYILADNTDQYSQYVIQSLGRYFSYCKEISNRSEE